MSRMALLAIALATATPALAQPADPAYRYSDTHAGGPADDLLNSTGGVPAPVRHTYSDPAYRYSDTHAGGPADDLISPTGGIPRVHASSLCVPKTSPQSALRSGPSLAQSEGSDSPDVSVTTPSIGPQTLMREPWGPGAAISPI